MANKRLVNQYKAMYQQINQITPQVYAGIALALHRKHGWEYEQIAELIEETETAYDVEKVVAELEQQAEQYRNRGFEHETLGYSLSADKYYGKQCSYLHAIDIVKRGGVE